MAPISFANAMSQEEAAAAALPAWVTSERPSWLPPEPSPASPARESAPAPESEAPEILEQEEPGAYEPDADDVPEFEAAPVTEAPQSTPAPLRERYVKTDTIKQAARGRGVEILHALGISWPPVRGDHVLCPYPRHDDRDPSWRWDEQKECAFCTCESGLSIFDVVMRVDGISFENAKVRVAELLGRQDLIVTPSQSKGVTLAQLADAKGLPIEFLREQGWFDLPRHGKYHTPAVGIPYKDQYGVHRWTRIRVALDGKRKFRWRKGDVEAPLYGTHMAKHLAAAGYVVLVGGESDAMTLWHYGIPALGLPGEACWNEERHAPLLDGVPLIYVIVEPDEGGRALLRWAARSSIRERVRLVFMPAETKDPSALHIANPDRFVEAFRAILDAAEPFDPQKHAPAKEEGSTARGQGDQADGAASNNEDAEIARLAELPMLTYERQRAAAANRLGIRALVLDKLVEQARGGIKDSTAGSPIKLVEPEPWPEPIAGDVLLDAIASAVRRHMVMTNQEADTVALWTAGTHLYDAFMIYPRLGITSPEPRCGKTTLLDILGAIVIKPLMAAHLTTAAVFRTVDATHPTLLIDEADTFLRDSPDLIGVLNAGHRRGGAVVRVVETQEGYEPRQFDCYAPAALAGIKSLPATLADRSVAIGLRRKRADEKVEALRLDRMEGFEELGRKLARWARDNLTRAVKADPVLPASLFNRVADNWRPLIAIADAAGGAWPVRARQAAEAAVKRDDGQTVIAMLLDDIRALFDCKGSPLFTSEILEALKDRDDRPWPEWKDGQPITSRQLAKLLKPLGIAASKTVRRGEVTVKGYRREDLDDAFARYAPPVEKEKEPETAPPR